MLFFSKQFDWLFVASNLAAFISRCGSPSACAKVKLGGEGRKARVQQVLMDRRDVHYELQRGAHRLRFHRDDDIFLHCRSLPCRALSIEAYEYAAMYTTTTGGLNARSLYVPASVAVGYMLYNRRQSRSA